METTPNCHWAPVFLCFVYRVAVRVGGLFFVFYASALAAAVVRVSCIEGYPSGASNLFPTALYLIRSSHISIRD